MHDHLLRTLVNLLHPSSRRGDRGQTAAEYLGIVVLVGAIIAAIFALGIDTTIADALGAAVDKVTGNG